MGKRVLYSGFKWKHHDEHSGYQFVAPDPRDYVDGGRLFGGKAVLGTILSRINILLVDLVTCVRGLRYDWVFIFYPEQTVYVSPLILRLAGVKIAYAVHLDEDYWFADSPSLSRKRKRWLTRFVDRFIVISRAQLATFERRFPGKVSFVPHGVWCSDTIEPRAAPPRIAVVGGNYRDYALMRAAILLFNDRFPTATFHLVGTDAWRMEFDETPPNTKVHGRLSSADYRAMLSGCTFMFLPLTYATANNALLEAFALGVPVVCNEVDGVMDYLPGDDYIVHDPEELAAFYQRRIDMTDDEAMQERRFIRDYCRTNFEWPVIHARVKALLDSL
jgi:glycosyltransferase involved in cell wall biosynthesis